MYFLLRIEGDTKKIVCHAKNNQLKTVMFANYCKVNNIEIFDNRQKITEEFKDKSLCTYKIGPERYIILDCTYHPQSFLYNEYVEKHIVGYLEFTYYKAPDYKPAVMPLTRLKGYLKQKINNEELIDQIEESMDEMEKRYLY